MSYDCAGLLAAGETREERFHASFNYKAMVDKYIMAAAARQQMRSGRMGGASGCPRKIEIIIF